MKIQSDHVYNIQMTTPELHDITCALEEALDTLSHISPEQSSPLLEVIHNLWLALSEVLEGGNEHY